MTTATTDWRKRPTLTVEEAAQILGIGRSTAYAAAGGDLPTIRIGRKILVPTARLRAMLGETEGAAAVGRDDASKLAGGDGHVEAYGE